METTQKILTLDDLKVKATSRKQELMDGRNIEIVDFDVPGVGIIGLSKPMPHDNFNILIEAVPFMNSDENGAIGLAKDDYIRPLLKMCAVRPVLDDDAITLILDVLDFGKRLELSNLCGNLMYSSNSEVDQAVENTVNFTEGTSGPLSESTPQ